MSEAIGEVTRPRMFCIECGEIEYCDTIWTNYPPGTAENRIKRKHKKTGCAGEIQYRAGVSEGLIRQLAKKVDKPNNP